ncbi:aldolase [bacterium]|nr:aldolase [bacterium]
MNESQLREQMAFFGQSLFDRGLSYGSSGNLSARLDDGFLVTPTNCCLGTLDPARITKIDREGNRLAGDNPTKEQNLHMAIYQENPDAGAVVHLHSTYSVALSCLDHDEGGEIVPTYTPYFIMRLGQPALVPYYPPGDARLAEAVRELAGSYKAILLANHGPVVVEKTLEKAIYAMEEFEASAKLAFLLNGQEAHKLNTAQIEELLNR